MGRRSKSPARAETRTRARARARARSRMRTRVLTASGIVAGALLVFAVVPKVSGGNHSAPDRDDAEVSLSEGPPVPPIAPEEPSARRDLPDRPAESASESPPSAEDIAARIAVRFPLEPTLRLGGKFTTVPGDEAAPGTGRKVTYRVEIEEGLALDGGLFAAIVQRTLNDPRSWSRDGKTFERTDSGGASFVIRLSSPGTLHRICSPIVGDTSRNNVSCNATGTPWVMINGWRWAQGSTAYGDDIVGYREMLINHEVGHRLGHQHSTRCASGGLAPVMMQQTKSRKADNGTICTANPWPYPAATG